MTKQKLAVLMREVFANEIEVRANDISVSGTVAGVWAAALAERDRIAWWLRTYNNGLQDQARSSIIQFVAFLFALRNALDKEDNAPVYPANAIFVTEIMYLREQGQKEYAHDDNNAFANFERAAADLGIDRKMILWVFAMKHRDGVQSFLDGHRSQRENVRGRINDLIVYSLILYGMIVEETSVPFVNA